MYPIPPHEHLVEMKSCRQCGADFPITDKDMKFYEKVSPVFPVASLTENPQSATETGRQLLPEGATKKYLIPPPTLCPECRQQRRLSFRNERKLYKRTCDATGKEIISIYSPDKPYTVYHQDYWWSDAWDPMEYGREFDFKRSSFGQFSELLNTVPVYSLGNADTVNSEYCNYIRSAKDCYLSSVVYYDSEGILYSNRIYQSNTIVDSITTYESQNCYECIDMNNCSNCYSSQSLYNSKKCYSCSALIGCNHCIECIGLSNVSYHIHNKAVTPEEFEKFLQGEYIPHSEKFEKLSLNTPKKSGDIVASENCTGDYIKNSKNCHFSFDIDNCEDCKYIIGDKAKNSYDGIGGSIELGYEYSRGGWGTMLIVVNDCMESHDLSYCDHVNFSHHCFLCVGLRNASYCILNKQYTKEEYEELVPKIIEKMREDSEWGEFFPATMSPFGYNETVANEYYPFTSSPTLLPQGDGSETFREVVIGPPSPTGEGMRVRWSLYETPFPKVEKVIPATKLPEDITKIPDDILNWAIECEVTGKPFRIIRQELEFYRKHNIPIPRKHPDQRHLDRMKQRNPRKLFERDCDCCKKQMITTYAPERPETVYCEECYLKII